MAMSLVKSLSSGLLTTGILVASLPTIATENTFPEFIPVTSTLASPRPLDNPRDILHNLVSVDRGNQNQSLEYSGDRSLPALQLSQNPVPSFRVNQVQVVGSTIFTDADFRPLVADLENKDFDLRATQEAVDRVTQLYLSGGYLTSRAVLAAPDPATGIVRINIIEGSVEKIEIEGLQRLNPEYIRSRLNLALSTPLNTARIEDQLRLLRNNPLFENIEASLRSGSTDGTSVVIVRVQEANSFFGGINFDNYSPPSVGSERGSLSVGSRNLTGLGDEASLGYTRTLIGGAESLDLNYRLPVNPLNGDLRVRASLSRNVVLQPPFDVFDIRGESQLYELSFRQPVILTPQEELAFSVGFSYQSGQTFTFAGPTPFGLGPEADGSTRTSTLRLGQEYTSRDSQGAWNFRSQFGIGLGILNATINSRPIPDGRFLTWLGQIQRLQVLDANNFLIIQADIQLTPNSLLPAQQFVIGGGQSIRGFRQNARAGDNGFRLSIEDRLTLQTNESGNPTLVLAPFIESGYVWNNSSNPNVLGDQNFLAGAGAGLIWQPFPKFNVRLDYGIPLVNLSDRGNNLQDSGFYFSLGYQF